MIISTASDVAPNQIVAVTVIIIIIIIIIIIVIIIIIRLCNKTLYKVVRKLEFNDEFGTPVFLIKPKELIPNEFAVMHELRKARDISINEQKKCYEKLINKELKNENVKRFYRVYEVPTCWNRSTTTIVLSEFIAAGYLKKILTNKNENRDRAMLLNICMQIANGMRYISSLDMIHGKIAVSSCLAEKSSDITVKIIDFTMSITLCKTENVFPDYVKKTDQIRWWATECFEQSVATPKTDVWAFGVTMWEVFTLCKNKPYHELSIEELTLDAQEGPNRRLLDCPSNCHDVDYQLMKSCWRHEPSERPDFEELYTNLKPAQQ